MPPPARATPRPAARMIRGAGASELMIPNRLEDGTVWNSDGTGAAQICDPHGNSAGRVLDARFALGVALEMARSEPEIARRAAELRQAETEIQGPRVPRVCLE